LKQLSLCPKILDQRAARNLRGEKINIVYALVTTASSTVLDHREDQEALQTFVDKRRAENPNPRVYQPGDDFKAAIAEHLESLRKKNQTEGDR
jgi:hypothetical protein